MAQLLQPRKFMLLCMLVYSVHCVFATSDVSSRFDFMHSTERILFREGHITSFEPYRKGFRVRFKETGDTLHFYKLLEGQLDPPHMMKLSEAPNELLVHHLDRVALLDLTAMSVGYRLYLDDVSCCQMEMNEELWTFISEARASQSPDTQHNNYDSEIQCDSQRTYMWQSAAVGDDDDDALKQEKQVDNTHDAVCDKSVHLSEYASAKVPWVIKQTSTGRRYIDGLISPLVENFKHAQVPPKKFIGMLNQTVAIPSNEMQDILDISDVFLLDALTIDNDVSIANFARGGKDKRWFSWDNGLAMGLSMGRAIMKPDQLYTCTAMMKCPPYFYGNRKISVEKDDRACLHEQQFCIFRRSTFEKLNSVSSAQASEDQLASLLSQSLELEMIDMKKYYSDKIASLLMQRLDIVLAHINECIDVFGEDKVLLKEKDELSRWR